MASFSVCPPSPLRQLTVNPPGDAKEPTLSTYPAYLPRFDLSLGEVRHGLHQPIMADAAKSHLLNRMMIEFCQRLSTNPTHSRLLVSLVICPCDDNLSNTGKHPILLMGEFGSGLGESRRSSLLFSIFYAKASDGRGKKKFY